MKHPKELFFHLCMLGIYALFTSLYLRLGITHQWTWLLYGLLLVFIQQNIPLDGLYLIELIIGGILGAIYAPETYYGPALGIVLGQSIRVIIESMYYSVNSPQNYPGKYLLFALQMTIMTGLIPLVFGIGTHAIKNIL